MFTSFKTFLGSYRLHISTHGVNSLKFEPAASKKRG